jgi:hypothetical protein
MDEMKKGPWKISPITQAAIDQVEQNANPDWLDAACAVAVSIAREYQEFTSVEVEERMRLRHPTITTHEARAMGPVMKWCEHNRIAKQTGETVRDPRPHCHQQYKTVWESLIFQSNGNCGGPGPKERPTRKEIKKRLQGNLF